MASDAMPPTVTRLGWLHFWNDFTLDFLTPLLPGQVGVAWLGVMEGLADAVGQGLKLFTGRASDRTGRRVPWVGAGYAVNALARPLAAVGVALSWPVWIVATRVADRVGKGLRGSATDALVADWTEGGLRARSFANMRTMDHLGATVGALAAALGTYLFPDHLTWLIAALVLPAVLTLLLASGLSDHPHDPAEVPAQVGWWPTSPRLRGPLLLIGLASLGAKLSPVLILAQVAGFSQEGGHWPLWMMCLGWAVLGFTQAIAAAVAGRWTERLGPQTFLVLGWTAGAILYAGLALASGWLAIGFGLGFAMLSGFTEGAEKTWFADLAPKEERATAFGALALLIAGAALIGSAVCGFGMAPQRFGSLVFLLPAAALALGAIVLVLRRAPANP